jgi:hypothetical protein
MNGGAVCNDQLHIRSKMTNRQNTRTEQEGEKRNVSSGVTKGWSAETQHPHRSFEPYHRRNPSYAPICEGRKKSRQEYEAHMYDGRWSWHGSTFVFLLQIKKMKEIQISFFHHFFIIWKRTIVQE